jgi:outer membrane protein assembly factor BamA
MNRFRVLTVLFLLGSAGFCQRPDTSGRTHTSAPDLSQFRIEVIIFEGGRSLSAEQLRDTFNVRVGDKFNHTAIGQGLDRLRQLYGDHGYINFSAVPNVQVEQDRDTVVLKISIDEGPQFNFGRLFLVGQETRAGEADALRKAWTALSGKTFDSSLLSDWLIKNATFLPNDGQPLRHVESNLSSDTHQADIAIRFPSPKS